MQDNGLEVYVFNNQSMQDNGLEVQQSQSVQDNGLEVNVYRVCSSL